MSDISVYETRTEFESKQKLIEELQRRLADAEGKLVEGEKLRKKLHNTILVISLSLKLLMTIKCHLLNRLHNYTGVKREHPCIL